MKTGVVPPQSTFPLLGAIPGFHAPGPQFRVWFLEREIDPGSHKGSEGNSGIGALPIPDTIPPSESSIRGEAETTRVHDSALSPLLCVVIRK